MVEIKPFFINGGKTNVELIFSIPNFKIREYPKNTKKEIKKSMKLMYRIGSFKTQYKFDDKEIKKALERVKKLKKVTGLKNVFGCIKHLNAGDNNE